MKKLLERIMSKEREDKNAVKANNSKDEKQLAPSTLDASKNQNQDLFSDEYSDIGYC